MHDAVTVVVRVQVELQGVPRVVNPLVWQHIEIVYPDMLVPADNIQSTSSSGVEDDQPVVPGVGVEEPHVVHQLVGDDPHRVRVRGVEAGQDPHPTRQT